MGPLRCSRLWLPPPLLLLFLGALSTVLGDYAPKRTLASSVNTGYYLSALRTDTYTGQEFGQTSTREFLDLMKHSTPFSEGVQFGVRDTLSYYSYNFPDDVEVNFTEDGYPTSLPEAYISWGGLRKYSVYASIGSGAGYVEDGDYVVTWTGLGNLTFEIDATLKEMNGTNTAIVTVAPSAGVVIRIVDTDPDDPIRNISMIHTNYIDLSPRPTFHPQFSETLAGATILRFSLWQRIDAHDTQASLSRDWDSRPQTWHQTQAGTLGVSIEHMIELANLLGANPWFSLPAPDSEESGYIDPYSENFAKLVNRQLDSTLKVYVEYRSCCSNGLAPGWNSENAIASLIIWDTWESVMDPERVVNTMSALAQISLYGNDVGKIEAAALEASFGDLCSSSVDQCVEFGSADAWGAYGNYSAEELIENVLWPAMLKMESTLNTKVQVALHYGLEPIAFNALPIISAGNYKHRGTLNWATQCDTCLASARGRSLGYNERAAALSDGWVAEIGVRVFYAYAGLDEKDRAYVDDAYYHYGTVAEAKVKCESASACKGFTYVKSGDWACGLAGNRYGNCDNPGAAYFFNLERNGAARRLPSLQCTTLSDIPASLDCSESAVDTYFKEDTRSESVQLAEEEAAIASCSTCQASFDSNWYTYTIPDEGFTLDRLHDVIPELVEKAAQEQTLEATMIEALRHVNTGELMLHYMERLRLVGFATVVSGTLHSVERRCPVGGKMCGVSSMMSHPDDDGPVRVAFQSYFQGVRGAPLEQPETADTTACALPCVYGVCEEGVCRCWNRVSGADCSILDTSARCDRPMGMNVAGDAYYSRQGIWVDTMKNIGEWIPQDLTSYTWNTDTDVEYRSDGYPAWLGVNQVVTLLTARDVERHHYPDGWYTVLYDGDGILNFGLDVRVTWRVKPGYIKLYVNLTTGANNGISMTMVRTNEDDPIRNIRIIMPGFETIYAVSPFHPAFKASLKHYNMFRYMGWMNVNTEGTTPWDWSERVTPDYYSQAVQGSSAEYMVLLSNEMAADPWFALPINATDEYFQEFATLVGKSLRPDLQVYVELANEVWGTLYFGGQWANLKASAEDISPLCWYTKRTSEMGVIMKEVFAKSGHNVTIIGSSQAVNPDVTSQILACEGASVLDAIAIAPYFNGWAEVPDQDSATIEQVLTSYNASIETSIDVTKKHKAVIDGTKKFLTYESGPAGEGDGTSTDLAMTAHRREEMRPLVLRYLEAMDTLLDQQAYFMSCGTPSKYGSWGLIEAMDQVRSEAPKYLGMNDFFDKKSTCEASAECVGSDGCNGNGICGTDDTCYCYRGYSGSTCLEASYTDYSACGYQCTFSQGVCGVASIVGNLRSWNCTCHEDYSGAVCSRFTCEDGCSNNGHCISSNVCSCFRGYKGEKCEVDCGCGHHGYCADDYTCICDSGYRQTADGTSCEWDCATYDTLGCVGPGQSACSDCQYGNCVDGFCRCWAGYYGASCSTLDSSLMANSGSPVGMNVGSSGFGTFVDVMKRSSGWTSIWAPDTYAGQFTYQGSTVSWTNEQYVWGNGQTISLDSDGYPTALEENQNLITLALRDVCHHAQDGRYVVLYDGDGEIDFSMDSSSAAFQKGRIDIDFAGTCKEECWFDKKTWKPYCTDNGVALRVKKTNPENPIRNIRIITPGFFATHHIEPFHPWFLKNLERFSFLRYMGMMNTNSDAHVKRSELLVTYVRFTVLSVRGGGTPRISELILKDPSDALIACTSEEWPELCDNNAYTEWAPGENVSVVVEVAEGSKLDSYMWVTSSWNKRVDPTTWTLETSTDGETWQVVDDRSLTQTVTYYRRSKAAKLTSEEESNYVITLEQDYLEWADRSTPDSRTQGPVAIENLVLLSNTVGAAPWVCVHHRASDDYVRQEATYWLNNLRPDLDVYVEHSNEVWNPLFPQGRHATAKGLSLGLADSTCRTNEGHCARVRYNAYRSKQIFAIWKEVWGAASSRLKLVLSTQTTWSDVSRDMLDVADVGATHLGITGYMSPVTTINSQWASWTEEEVMEDFVAGVEPLRSKLQAQKEIATANSLELAVYEGGLGLVEDGVIEGGPATGYVTELLIATGRNPALTAKMKQYFDMFTEELGSTPFGYFTSVGFWSKYGLWGMREFYDASIANSAPAAAVHEWLDEVHGARPSCLKANTFGRGLLPDSYAGPPAVWTPAPQAQLVAGESYTVSWEASERMASGKNLTFYLWQTTSCTGSGTAVGTAYMQAGSATWTVPATLAGEEFFIELRSEAPDTVPSNYSGLFTILAPEDAPVSYLLYVANDVDLLSAFHRNCKGDKDYAIKSDFKINSCVYSSAEGCRTYRTSVKRIAADGPPPWVHGSFKPLTDCTLHVLGIRQTMALEGLTQTFDTSSAKSLAKIVANASQLPEGAVAITINGRRLGDRLLSEEEGRHLSSTVEVTISINTDDGGISSVAQALAGVSKNTAFAKTAAAALGVESLTVSMSDDLSTEDVESSNPIDESSNPIDNSGSDDTPSSNDDSGTDSDSNGTNDTPGSSLTNASCGMRKSLRTLLPLSVLLVASTTFQLW